MRKIKSKEEFKYLDMQDIFPQYEELDMLNEVKNVIKDPILKPHDDLYDCFINFLVYDLGALVIDEGYLDVLSEDYDNLDKRLKTLHTFEVTYKVKVDENGNPIEEEDKKDKEVIQKYKFKWI